MASIDIPKGIDLGALGSLLTELGRALKRHEREKAKKKNGKAKRAKRR